MSVVAFVHVSLHFKRAERRHFEKENIEKLKTRNNYFTSPFSGHGDETFEDASWILKTDDITINRAFVCIYDNDFVITIIKKMCYFPNNTYVREFQLLTINYMDFLFSVLE